MYLDFDIKRFEKYSFSYGPSHIFKCKQRQSNICLRLTRFSDLMVMLHDSDNLRDIENIDKKAYIAKSFQIS